MEAEHSALDQRKPLVQILADAACEDVLGKLSLITELDQRASSLHDHSFDRLHTITIYGRLLVRLLLPPLLERIAHRRTTRDLAVTEIFPKHATEIAIA